MIFSWFNVIPTNNHAIKLNNAFQTLINNNKSYSYENKDGIETLTQTIEVVIYKWEPLGTKWSNVFDV